MSSFFPLDQLEAGGRAVLAKIDQDLPCAARLGELGFFPGVSVVCAFKGRRGENAAYALGGALIALRREDAAGILVSPVREAG